MEKKIGETILTKDGELLKVVAKQGCKGCFFNDRSWSWEKCEVAWSEECGVCSSALRDDQTSVQFQLVTYE